MANDELQRIIDVVSDCMDIISWDIRYGNNRAASRARGYVCHLIYNAYPYLEKKFCAISGLSRQAFYNAAKRTNEHVLSDDDLLKDMNFIRRKMNLIPLKKDEPVKGKKEYISNTKRMFGFDYSEEEKLRYEHALIASTLYMRKYCSYGSQPIEEGMVYSMKNGLARRSWYRD